jgi:sRNA-binding carbon storage regulator CsrA
MLILTQILGRGFVFSDARTGRELARVHVLGSRGNRIKFGLEADANVSIRRSEVSKPGTNSKERCGPCPRRSVLGITND